MQEKANVGFCDSPKTRIRACDSYQKEKLGFANCDK